ncbi:MAG: efflux RND transporter periplasmic adaptor subunit [Myxococcota bacterium]
MVSKGAMARDGVWRIGRGLLFVAGGFLLVGLAYGGLTRDLPSVDAGGPLEFRSEAVVRGDLRQTVVATGRVEALTRVPVKSEVSGVVRKVYVEEGDRVRRNEPLFDLDRDRLEDRVNASQAALEIKRAAARWDLVGRATLELEQDRRDHARITQLFERGVSSRSDFEDSAHRLKLAKVGLSDAQAEEAARAAAVLEAEHRLSQAEKDLERAVIRAPIDGLVIERRVDLGAVVADVTASMGTLLAVVVDDQRIRLVAEVDENDIAPVRVGQRAEISIDAFPGEKFEGYVRKVSSSGTVEEHVSNFEIEVELPADDRLRVGMSADARVVVKEYRDVLLIPNAAIVRGRGGPSVRVRDPKGRGGFRTEPIHEVYSDGFHTVIDRGPEEGQPVLVPRDTME